MSKANSLRQELLLLTGRSCIREKTKLSPSVLAFQFEDLMKRYPRSERKNSLKSLPKQLELSFYENESSAEKEDGPLVMKPNDPFYKLGRMKPSGRTTRKDDSA